MINPGVVAAIRAVGVRGDPCGAMRRIVTVVLVGLHPTSTTVSHLTRTISTNCWTHTVVPPDDGPRYARNM